MDPYQILSNIYFLRDILTFVCKHLLIKTHKIGLNSRPPVRRPAFYPLSYGGMKIFSWLSIKFSKLNSQTCQMIGRGVHKRRSFNFVSYIALAGTDIYICACHVEVKITSWQIKDMPGTSCFLCVLLLKKEDFMCLFRKRLTANGEMH